MNELDRFAEMSDEGQVRRFSNSLRMRDVGDEVHDRSKPFAGALFDTLIEIYQVILLERGLTDLDPRDFTHLRMQLSEGELVRQLHITEKDYGLHHYAVKSALAEARDILGQALVQSWRYMDADSLSFGEAKEALIAAAETGRGSRYTDRIADNFAWRGIA